MEIGDVVPVMVIRLESCRSGGFDSRVPELMISRQEKEGQLDASNARLASFLGLQAKERRRDDVRTFTTPSSSPVTRHVEVRYATRLMAPLWE